MRRWENRDGEFGDRLLGELRVTYGHDCCLIVILNHLEAI